MPPPATKYESLMRTSKLRGKTVRAVSVSFAHCVFCVKTDDVHGMLEEMCEPSPFAPKLRA